MHLTVSLKVFSVEKNAEEMGPPDVSRDRGVTNLVY